MSDDIESLAPSAPAATPDATQPATLAERLLGAGIPIDGPRMPSHPDVATWRTATRADVEEIHAVFAAADRVDHPTWVTPLDDIADTFDLSHVDHGRDTILALTADGTVVAVGSATRHPDASERIKVYLEGAVHPQWRRSGIGAALASWQFQRGVEQLAESGAALPGEIDMYAHDRNDGAVAIAETLGLRTARWFTSMVRDNTDDAPESTPPVGMELVPYTADRADAVRLARNDAFRDHWGSLPSEPERWAKFVGGRFFRPELSTLALADGRVVALCLASVNEDDWETLGASNSYIDLIGVVREHRGRGLARQVISRTLRAITDAGLAKTVLDVDTDSPTGAHTLYERLGFVATERERALTREF